MAALLALAAPLRAQELTDPAAQPPRYRIELLVFQHLDPLAVPELWTPPPLPEAEWPVPRDAEAAYAGPLPSPAGGPESEVPPSPPSGVETEPLVGDETLPMSFELLRPEALELTSLAGRLRQLGDYQPLLHIGWIQVGYPQAEALPFHLTGLDRQRLLSGTATLWVARFPHLALDLELVADPAAFDSVAPRKTYRIEERRRVRREERHYFDHPYFGVIAVVRYAEQEAAPALDAQPAS